MKIEKANNSRDMKLRRPTCLLLTKYIPRFGEVQTEREHKHNSCFLIFGKGNVILHYSLGAGLFPLCIIYG